MKNHLNEVVYGSKFDNYILYQDQYKDYQYYVVNNKDYPSIYIDIKKSHPLSERKDIISKIKFKTRSIYLCSGICFSKRIIYGNFVSLNFNSKNDYVFMEHDGKRWRTMELIELAKELIEPLAKIKEEYEKTRI